MTRYERVWLIVMTTITVVLLLWQIHFEGHI